jgi:hypothetical protein
MTLSLLWLVRTVSITCLIYQEYSFTTVFNPDTKVLFGVLFCGSEEQDSSVGLLDCLRAVLESKCAGELVCRLQQAQLAGTRDRFGAPLDLQFAKDFPIVSLHRVQGEEQPLTHLLI